MAAEIGVRVKIDGYAEFKRQITEINQSQKTLKSEMNAVSSAWDKSTSAEKKNAEIKKNLAQQIELQKQKVESLRSALEQVEAKYGENSREAESWREKLNNATAELNQMETALKNLPSEIQQFGESMKTAGEKVGKLADAVMPISAAVAAVGAASVKMTADFDSSMSKVAAISGATGADFDALRAKAREMGAETKFSAQEAADAFTYMAMAGWKTEDMMQGIDGIMALSAADGLDLAATSDIVTDALTALGMGAQDAGHFADVLAAASTNANTNVEMMGETFKYAAPLAGSLGFACEDLAVATGLMANAGIKGSQAGTALRGWLTRLAKPTKDSATAMAKLGLSLTDEAGNMKSLMQIIEETRDAFDGLSEAEAAQYAAMLAGQNGMSGFLAIVNASESDLKKLANATKNADGTAKKMAETMQNNLNGQLTILKSQLSEAGISIGDILVPKIREMLSHVQNAVDWFNHLSDAQKEQIVSMGMMVAATGPALKALEGFLKVGGGAVESIGGMAKTVAELGGVGNALNAVLMTTSANLALVAAPLAILAAAFWEAGQNITGVDKNLEGLRARSQETNAAIEQTTSAIAALNDEMSKNGEKIQLSDSSMEHWRTQLNSCYDANGNLKEGMEQTAEYALTQLNKAMGTDYSTEFIRQAKDSKAALDEVNSAIDTYLLKVKQQAIESAFSTEYADAIKNQASAQNELNQKNLQYQQTVDGAKKAVQEFEAAQKEVAKTSATGGVASPESVARLSEATKKCNEYRTELATAGEKLKEASGNAAKANQQVEGLTKTMDLLAQGGAENVNKAADAYANIATNSEKAGQKAEETTGKVIKSFEDIQKETIKAPEFDQTDAEHKAEETTKTMQGTFDNNKFVGQVDKVDGGDQAAMNAAGQMTKIVSVPMQGKIDKVNGAESAASAARQTMQNFLDQHPIIATVVEVVTGGKVHRSNVDQNAEGGLVTTERLSWVAEGNQPEMIIPLSAGKRARALDLYAQTGQALGVGYIPGNSYSATYNTGHNTINVYGAPGQDVRELAEEIADIINGDVNSKGAAWA